MAHENKSAPSLSWRCLLGQAVGAAVLAETAQAQPSGENSAPRTRDSFDFGWRIFKGDAPGAQQPDLMDAPWRGVPNYNRKTDRLQLGTLIGISSES